MNKIVFQKVLSLLFIIMNTIGLQLTAQENGLSFTLKEAQEYAIKNGYSSRTAIKEVEKSERVVKETIATGLPQINATGNYQKYVQTPTQLIPGAAIGMPEQEFVEVFFGTEQSMGIDIKAEQLLFDGSYFIGLQASQVFLELSKNDLQKTKNDIRHMVTQAYGAALVSEENVDILKENAQNLEQNFNESKALYENGFIEEQDRDQMELLLISAKNAHENGIRQMTISRNQLKFIMGIPIESKVELTEDLTQLIQPNLEQSFLENDLNLQGHIDFKIISTREKASELLLKQQKSLNLPRLSAFYSYQQNSFSNEFDFFGDAQWFPAQLIGLNVNVPIFSGLGRHHKTQQAKIELEQVAIAREQVEEQLKVQAANSKSEYTFALNQYNSANDNLNLAKSIYEKTKIKYKEGISTSLELTQANNQLLEVQGNYINASLQLINAKSNLDQALNNY